MRILLTGASGFVGKHLLPILLENKHDVTAIYRKSPNLTYKHDYVVLPISSDTDWTEMLRNVDAIVHMGDGYNAFEQVPLTESYEEAEQRFEASKALIRAAIKSKIPKFVYLSSIKAVCGTELDSIIITEQTLARPSHLYGSLKLQTEKFLLENAKDSNTQGLALRFPLTFSAASTGSFSQLIKLADTPFPLPLAGLNNRRSLISLESLIGVVAKMMQPNHYQGNGAFFIHDGAITLTELMVQLRVGLNRSKRLFPLHRSIWSMFRQIPRLREVAERFSGSLEISDQHFRETFGSMGLGGLNNKLKKAAIDYRQINSI